MYKKALLTFAALAGLLVLSATFAPPSHAAIPPQALAQAGSQAPTLAPMLKRVLPSVVGIVSEGEAQVANNPLMNDPFFRYFFDLPQRAPREKTRGIGSGVIIDAKRGYIITNSHVVEDATKVTVKLADDREIVAKVVGSDPETDVAVIQISATELQALPIADSDQLQVGDFVLAIGNPFGLRQTVTSGIVSALGRSGIGNKYENFIQTDASINPGNSGGALINLNGELVGINSAIFSTSGGNIGIGFAIPTNTVQVVMKQIIEYGQVQRGQLGIVGQDLSPELAKAFGIKQTHGVVIAQVVNDSAADKAGLKTGDVITAVNGREIKEFAQLRNAIGLLRIGDTVTIDVLREGKPKTFTAKIIAAKETTVTSSGTRLHPGLEGAVFAEMDSDHPLAGRVEGVLVKEVEPGSAAAEAGLMPGDVVTSVNRRPITSLDAFKALAGVKSGQVLLHLRRGRGALFLLIQ
jgi:serine protease Do/serine protease DegQ